jgi:hypothetical protein
MVRKFIFATYYAGDWTLRTVCTKVLHYWLWRWRWSSLAAQKKQPAMSNLRIVGAFGPSIHGVASKWVRRQPLPLLAGNICKKKSKKLLPWSSLYEFAAQSALRGALQSRWLNYSANLFVWLLSHCYLHVVAVTKMWFLIILLTKLGMRCSWGFSSQNTRGVFCGPVFGRCAPSRAPRRHCRQDRPEKFQRSCCAATKWKV